MLVGITDAQDGEVPRDVPPCTPEVARSLHPSGALRQGPLETGALVDIAKGLALAVQAGPSPAVVDGDARDAADGQDGGAADVHRERLLATTGYDAWLVTWPPGALLEEHDHDGSVGVVHVLSGALVEFASDLDPARPTVRRELRAGSTTEFGASGRHRLANVAGDTRSVHVYSPPLGPG